MIKDRGVYLRHIRDAIDAIDSYTERGKDSFLRDEKTQDAVIYNVSPSFF